MSGFENITLKHRVFLLSQSVFQLLLAVFVTSTIWLMASYRNWQSLHTWHVFLSTIGFSLFMACGISLLNPGNVLTLGCSRLSRGFLHGALMFLGFVAAIAGVSIKIHDKILNNSSHFVSVHAITGFTSYLLTIIAFIGGFFVAFGKQLYGRLGIKPVYLRNCHIFFGIAAYVLGVVALGYGLRNYFREASDATNTGFIVILTIYSGLNLFGPITTFFGL